MSEGGEKVQTRETAPANRATIRYMSQLLLVRTLAPSRPTTLVFAIFSSIERGSSSPRGDTPRLLFFPDAGAESVQRQPLERAARIPRFLPASVRAPPSAAGAGAIRLHECQTPSSCRPGCLVG